MKKIAIIILVLAVAFSNSCKKEEHIKVITIFKGQLRTNGTEDAIRMSIELDRPIVEIYTKRDPNPDNVVIGGAHPSVTVASTTVDKNGNFYIEAELYKDEWHSYDVKGCDLSVYNSNVGVVTADYRIKVGEVNMLNIYVPAISWVRPRFINTNTDVNNVDVFEYRGGLSCDNCGSSGSPPVFNGVTDTTLYWVGKTWSGTYRTGVVNNYLAHKVYGKLMRNGVTRDTSIIYTAPPFDTTVVEIRY